MVGGIALNGEVQALASMGVTWGDYDHSGRLSMFVFFLMIRRPPSSPLFPSRTLFRSSAARSGAGEEVPGGDSAPGGHLRSGPRLLAKAVYEQRGPVGRNGGRLPNIA